MAYQGVTDVVRSENTLEPSTHPMHVFYTTVTSNLQSITSELGVWVLNTTPMYVLCTHALVTLTIESINFSGKMTHFSGRNVQVTPTPPTTITAYEGGGGVQGGAAGYVM